MRLTKEFELAWPQVWDQHREVIEKFKIKAYPTYVLVGPGGEILFRSKSSSPQTTRLPP